MLNSFADARFNELHNVAQRMDTEISQNSSAFKMTLDKQLTAAFCYFDKMDGSVGIFPEDLDTNAYGHSWKVCHCHSLDL